MPPWIDVFKISSTALELSLQELRWAADSKDTLYFSSRLKAPKLFITFLKSNTVTFASPSGAFWNFHPQLLTISRGEAYRSHRFRGLAILTNQHKDAKDSHPSREVDSNDCCHVLFEISTADFGCSIIATNMPHEDYQFWKTRYTHYLSSNAPKVLIVVRKLSPVAVTILVLKWLNRHLQLPGDRHERCI